MKDDTKQNSTVLLLHSNLYLLNDYAMTFKMHKFNVPHIIILLAKMTKQKLPILNSFLVSIPSPVPFSG